MTPILAARLRRALPAAAVVTLAAIAGACKDVLSVQRPTLITPESVQGDSTMISAMVEGVEGEFRTEYAWVAHAGAAQSGEAIFSHVWSPWNQFGDRNVTADGGAYDGLTYPFLQRARATGEQFVTALKQALGARAANHPGYARALAYAGYSYLLIADHLCAIPIDGSAPKTPDEVRKLAIPYFTEAAQVAAAANTPDYVNMANVGLARAYLGMGDKTNALLYAKKVPATWAGVSVKYAASPDFGQWTYYNLYNRISGLRSPAEFNLAYDPTTMATVRDLRVPFETDSTRRMLDARAPRYGYLPYEPQQFSHWTPGGKTMMQQDAAITFASGLEAQYMVAEAGGMSPGEMRAFINARRAVGKGSADPFAGTDDQLFDQLIEQRKWDFYLAGFHMPDLIRYKRFYNKNLWPTGPLGGFTSGYVQNRGTTECWPIGVTESNANPNIPNS